MLVVDDTEAKRYLIAQTLRLAGMEVLEASSGGEALAAVATQPDVVVLDVRLSDMNGFDVCRRLKQNPVTAAIPVLYISALLRDEELEERLFVDGADGYIPQPIESKHLVAQTWALVRMRRAELARQREREEAEAERQRLQRELERSQARARRLTESGMVGIVYWDLDGTILDANDTFLSLVGYTREDLARGLLDWRKMTPPEWEAADARAFGELQAQGVSVLYEKQYLRKDGTRVDVMLGVASLEGEADRGVTMVVDLTERREAERRLKQLMLELESSRSRLRMALDAAELGTWSYDIPTGEVRWDARAKEMFGLPPQASVRPEVWRTGVHPEDLEQVTAAVERALSGGNGGFFGTEFRVVGLQDGMLRWVSARGRVLFDEAGRALSFSGIWLDITERKLNEQRSAALQATTAAFANALTPRQVAEALVEHGLKSLDAYAGSVSQVEDGQLRMISHFGYPSHILQKHGDFPLDIRAPSCLAALEGRTVWLQATESLEREWPEFFKILQGSRSRTWLSIPLKDGERVVGVLGLSFSSLRRFSPQDMAHLESLCALCAQALARAWLYEEERRAKEEARQRAELEQQFLGVVSHDLRNPLMAISLGARTLQRMEKPAPEALLRTAGRIANSADTMGRMISDLLDFTRGRLGGGIPLERERNEMVRLCREVIDEFSVTHPDRDIRLEGDALCEGQWDGPRMRQVLSNLLSNALRHAREGSAVCVRVLAREGEVELSVFNEGAPIPEELLPVLFEPFRRGMSKFRPSGSLGLGLYIVRQVVEGHGGRVEVSTGEAGTTFTVRVSQTAEPPPRRGEDSRPGP
ncbi:PAS domain S-box protein [Archangium violaceum]|uniref:PAS domain S-box protein n=1 Tax=Archangium violaceum TaxID=83451 RepID=UPI00193BBD3B|nr:PAS domain S-box protein [Archangium violaceum]QRK10836.1 PAS domain S-box protein [Archangium violaceum]